MKCPKCHGRGTHVRRERCNHPTSFDCCIAGCNDQVSCRRCKGFGFSGGELVLELLLQIKRDNRQTGIAKLVDRALKEFEG
jgi:hypothetical protein